MGDKLSIAKSLTSIDAENIAKIILPYLSLDDVIDILSWWYGPNKKEVSPLEALGRAIALSGLDAADFDPGWKPTEAHRQMALTIFEGRKNEPQS